MNESKHTPGIWLVSNSGGKVITGGMRHPSVIAILETVPLRITLEVEANANLIAAAPDLLTACKAQHEAIDRLAAMLAINFSKGFFLSESGQPWKALQQGNAAIVLAEKGI
jgi:hypothetical protein